MIISTSSPITLPAAKAPRSISALSGYATTFSLRHGRDEGNRDFDCAPVDQLATLADSLRGTGRTKPPIQRRVGQQVAAGVAARSKRRPPADEGAAWATSRLQEVDVSPLCERWRPGGPWDPR